MLLKLEKIGKIYDSNDILTVGIRGIDLAFDYNEFVTIEGESGSGKSTLLNVIGANDTYEEGELYFNGIPLSRGTDTVNSESSLLNRIYPACRMTPPGNGSNMPKPMSLTAA